MVYIETASGGRDLKGIHIETASGGAYIETASGGDIHEDSFWEGG